MRKSLLLIIGTPTLSMMALNAVAVEPNLLQPVVIIGSSDDVKELPGSGALVDNQLEQQAISDVNQALKTVPGIYIREEDGEGLRPNIGIRGATSERSEKITLLEDGVLIAPAPYSNPAAYYFPTAMRMSSIEIIKGAPLLRYGPQTTGGVVNFVTTPLLTESGGSASFMMNDRGALDLHTHFGQRTTTESGQDFIWQFETVQRDSRGFKEIDQNGSGGELDAGHDIQDYVLKLGWEGETQSLLFKGQYSEEISNETYLGLTEIDFAENSNRRYGLSSIDQMNNTHDGLSLAHVIDWSDTVQQRTTIYKNTFHRDWFKLGGGGAYIDDANSGDANAQGILDGTIDETGLGYMHNNRAYESKGIFTEFELAFGAHLVQVGARSHQDSMDRLQPTDVYDQVNGSLVYQSTTAPTGSNNRIEEADALSFWIADDWQVSDRLNTQFVLRFEDVESSRVQYGDEARTMVSSTRSNDSSELLPGASLTYDLNDNFQVLAGVHKGFSPLGGGASENESAETSTNWEAGIRYGNESVNLETIGFYSNFSNKAENCSLASPCSNGDTSGRFVTGAAEIAGIEFLATKSAEVNGYKAPLQASYTYTKATISETNGSFSDGDQLKDVPEHVLSLQAGLETSVANHYIVGKFQSYSCVTTGCNRNEDIFDRTESLFTVDAISHIPMNGAVDFVVKVENIFDRQHVVSRSPDGARPNKPATVSLGMNVDF